MPKKKETRGRPRIDPEDIKIPFPVGIKRGTAKRFDARVKKLGLTRSGVVQELLEQFIYETRKSQI